MDQKAKGAEKAPLKSIHVNVELFCLFTCLTLGIFGIYWIYLLVKNTRLVQGREGSCAGEVLCLLFVPFYSNYWWYTRGQAVKAILEGESYRPAGNGLVYLALSLLGWSPVNLAVMQSDFNLLPAASHRKINTKKLVVCAMMVALSAAIAFVCRQIPFFTLPFGGTFTIASMLPIILVCYLYGPSWGFATAFAGSLFQLLVDFQTVGSFFTPASDSYMGIRNAVFILLLDYILAFTVVAVASFFRKLKPLPGLVVGSAVGLAASYVSHVLSGTVFFGAWAEWFFTETLFKDIPLSQWILTHLSGTALAATYSCIYNACWMVPELVITVIAAAAVSTVPVLMKEKAK